ncbi:hypothetical protein ACFT2C_04120 [Promicromonospora sp. NPDC057138]|uniref:hypothetical protein n=1 Tax=Promicromonospora sp. NPDC057138 TaxID=3346031 RepID=UPI00363272CD
MAREQTLTVGQHKVLEWIGAGCPAGTYDDDGYAHRISARALQSRGLVVIKGRGATWSATITDSGIAYLAAPEVAEVAPVRAPRKRVPRPVKASRPAAPGPACEPDPVDTSGLDVSTPEPMDQEPVPEPGLDAASALIARVMAEGRVEYDEKNDEVGYERLVAESMRSPARPFGKKLETVWIGGYWDGRRAVQLTEHFPDHVQARPVPVSQRVSQYDSAVKAFLKSKDWQFVSAEHLTRAGHVLQAIAVEAKRRGYRVLSTGSARGRGQSGWSPRKARLVVEIRGQEYGMDLREKPRPGAAKLPPRNYSKPPRLPEWMERRRYEFLPSGVFELNIEGGFGGGRTQTFRDGKKARLEDLLPEVLREMEIRVLETEWREQEAERAKQARRARWEAAVERGRRDFHEAQRSKVLLDQLDAWQRHHALGEYLAAMAEKIDQLEGEERAAAEEWLVWSQQRAQRLDPLNGTLAVPRFPDPTSDELKPFLKGWSPYGPEY